MARLSEQTKLPGKRLNYRRPQNAALVVDVTGQQQQRETPQQHNSPPYRQQATACRTPQQPLGGEKEHARTRTIAIFDSELEVATRRSSNSGYC
eukprot:scaffold17660_cov92-Amphora_coffeaeformis.AAC.2